MFIAGSWLAVYKAVIIMLDTSLLSPQGLHRQPSMLDDHRSRYFEDRDGERICSFLQPSCESLFMIPCQLGNLAILFPFAFKVLSQIKANILIEKDVHKSDRQFYYNAVIERQTARGFTLENRQRSRCYLTSQK